MLKFSYSISNIMNDFLINDNKINSNNILVALESVEAD